MKSRYPLLFFAGSVLLLVLASLAAFAILMTEHLRHGDQFVTTWTEELSIYSTWKIAHGYPAYEWPTKDWYSLSMYNWLYYYFYGTVAWLAHAQDMHAVLLQRILTFLFATTGCVLTCRLTHYLVRALGLIPNRLIIVTGSLLLWFGWGGMLFDAFTVRPDAAAQVFSLSGLCAFLWALRSRTLAAFVLSSLLFYLAWAFKQSVVFTFASCMLYLLLTLQWRTFPVFAGTFFLLVAIALFSGGEVYRYDVLKAPAIYPFTLGQGLGALSMFGLHGFFICGFLAYFPILWFSQKPRLKSWFELDALPLPTRQLLALLLAVLVTGAMDLLVFTKEGSDVNAAFEFLIVSGVLAIVSVHHLLQTNSPSRPAWLIYASLLFLISTLSPAKNVLWQRHKLTMTPQVSQSDYETRVRYGEWLRTLPSPLLVRDALFALPWYSNHGNYPAIITDLTWHPCAEKRGLLAGGGIQSLVKSHYFATLLLTPDDALTQVARDAGYQEEPLPEDRRYFQSSSYLRQEGPLILLVRPPAKS